MKLTNSAHVLNSHSSPHVSPARLTLLECTVRSLRLMRYAEIAACNLPVDEASIVVGDHDPFGELRQRYRDFALLEAAGRSAPYETLANGIAASDEVLKFIATLPRAKQQPNLVLAAVRLLFGVPSDARHLARVVAEHEDEIREVVLLRSTQTNEPGRCAALLPLLAAIPGPLALLELGASAGLCLLPDRYAFDYGTATVQPLETSRSYPTFPCRVSGPVPVPSQLPEIRWRRGIDLNPLDVSDPEQVRWLETLVWPGQEGRSQRLREAVAVAQLNPPPVFKGDLRTDFEHHAAEAPGDCTLVVFHFAVFAYLEPADRADLVRRITSMGATWISCESPDVLPACASQLRVNSSLSEFLICRNGEPVAFADPHGSSLRWLRPGSETAKTR